MKTFEFRLTFHWSLFLRVKLTISQHWFRQWFGAEPMMVSLLTHICVIWSQWVKDGLDVTYVVSCSHHCACRWPSTVEPVLTVPQWQKYSRIMQHILLTNHILGSISNHYFSAVTLYLVKFRWSLRITPASQNVFEIINNLWKYSGDLSNAIANGHNEDQVLVPPMKRRCPGDNLSSLVALVVVGSYDNLRSIERQP